MKTTVTLKTLIAIHIKVEKFQIHLNQNESPLLKNIKLWTEYWQRHGLVKLQVDRPSVNKAKHQQANFIMKGKDLQRQKMIWDTNNAVLHGVYARVVAYDFKIEPVNWPKGKYFENYNHTNILFSATIMSRRTRNPIRTINPNIYHGKQEDISMWVNLLSCFPEVVCEKWATKGRKSIDSIHTCVNIVAPKQVPHSRE